MTPARRAWSATRARVTTTPTTLRLARSDDVPLLEALIPLSAHALQADLDPEPSLALAKDAARKARDAKASMSPSFRLLSAQIEIAGGVLILASTPERQQVSARGQHDDIRPVTRRALAPPWPAPGVRVGRGDGFTQRALAVRTDDVTLGGDGDRGAMRGGSDHPPGEANHDPPVHHPVPSLLAENQAQAFFEYRGQDLARGALFKPLDERGEEPFDH